MHLSIIIPAYNEESRIERTLEEYYSTFTEIYGDNFEIIVEMDGCTDGTPVIVRNFARDKPNVMVLQFSKRLGKGGGIKKALALARGAIIGFTDADNSTPPREFLKLVNTVERGFDLAVCSRWLKESVVTNPQPLHRRFLSRGFNFLVRTMLGITVKDTQCGAKVFTREFAEHVVSEIEIVGFAFDVEMIYLANVYGFRVMEVPIHWHNYEGSKLNVKKAIPEMLISLLKIRLKKRNEHPKIYDEVGMPGINVTWRK